MLINWSELKVYEKKDEDVRAPWLLVLESFGDATHLKIESEGTWQAAGSVLSDSDPDGLAGLNLPNEHLVVTGCRFGALIGKVGGSSAIHHVPEKSSASPVADEPFALGTFCLLKLPEETFGPLFIGFNTVSRPIKVKTLKVKISGARPTI